MNFLRKVVQVLTAPFTDYENDVDDYNDLHASIFYARLAVAQKKLKANEFKAAETHFRTCLSTTAMVATLPLHTIIDLKLELASACRGSGNHGDQQAIILELLGLETSKLQESHLQHCLAVAYLDNLQFESARRFAEAAANGRRKLLGRHHKSYFESLSLLVDICNEQENFDEAEVYQHLLPVNFRRETGASLSDASIDTAAIKLTLENNCDANNEVTFFAALNEAAKHNNKAAIRHLLELGTNVKGHGDDGYTMLMYASQFGLLDIAGLLLNLGADIEAKSTQHFTSLDIAIWNKHEAVVQLLLERGAKATGTPGKTDSCLLIAASLGLEAIVKLLVDHGFDIERQGYLERTALHVSSLRGYIGVVRLLLDRGANINSECVRWRTPLMYAAREGRDGIVLLLLERGANPHAEDTQKMTALDCAKARKHDNVVRMLKVKRKVRLRNIEN